MEIEESNIFLLVPRLLVYYLRLVFCSDVKIICGVGGFAKNPLHEQARKKKMKGDWGERVR